MIRKLLTTTAMAALLSTAMATGGVAIAADTKDAASTKQEMRSGEYFHTSGEQILASNLIGKPVYNSTGGEAERIGEVNDVVMTPEGETEALVIGVGGFLGINEKDVAIRFDQVEWVERDGERWLVVSAGKEELENAPEFDRMAIENRGDDERRAEEGEMRKDEERQTAARDGDAAENRSDNALPTPDRMNPFDNRDQLTRAEPGVISAEKMLGTSVYGANDDRIGEVGDVILSSQGEVEAYVVDVGGFLGIGEKPVAVDASDLDVRQDAGGGLYIFTNYTQEQLEGQREYDEEAYRADRDSVVMQ